MSSQDKKTKAASIVMMLVMIAALSGCGAEKMEDIIRDACQNEASYGNAEGLEMFLSSGRSIDVTADFLTGFEYLNQGVSIGGDVGFYVDGEYINGGRKENGAVMAFDGQLKMTLPGIVSRLGIDVPDNIPLKMYASVDGDFSELTMYSADMDGNKKEWIKTGFDLNAIYSVIGTEDTSYQISFADILTGHSKIDRKLGKQGSMDVYVLHFSADLSDEQILDYLKERIDKSNIEQEQKDQIYACLKDYGRFIPISAEYYITKEDHKFSYFHIDISDMDTKGILSVLKNNNEVPYDVKDSLDNISVTIKRAYIECMLDEKEDVVIPQEVTVNAKEALPVTDTDTGTESEDNKDQTDPFSAILDTSELGAYNKVPFALLNTDIFVLDNWEIDESCVATNPQYPNTHFCLISREHDTDKDSLKNGLGGYEVSVKDTEDNETLPPWEWNGVVFGDDKDTIRYYYGEPDFIGSADGYLNYSYTYDGFLLTFYINDGGVSEVRDGLVMVQLDNEKY